MKLLLLTTLPNQVYNRLRSLDFLDLDVIDFSQVEITKSRFHAMLLDTVQKKHYTMMLTYRCPYVILREIREKVDCCVNIHPVSLPEFAGVNPWEKLKRSGQRHSEVMLHLMEEIPDSGKVLCSRPYNFDNIEEGRRTADIVASELIRDYFMQYKPQAHKEKTVL